MEQAGGCIVKICISADNALRPMGAELARICTLAESLALRKKFNKFLLSRAGKT
jgi:hypothetical protein